MQREQKWHEVEKFHPDLIVIGGGATGLGVALDAVSRGLRPLVLEQSDFAKGTSSRATKLAHGGVRYLAQGNVSLVREALRERAYMMKRAPHLVRKQRFVIPFYRWWMGPYYFTGLKLYDWLAGRLGIAGTRWLSAKTTAATLPSIQSKKLSGGISYWDGQFDDARLAYDLASTITQQGGLCMSYCRVTQISKIDGKISGVLCSDTLTGKSVNLDCSVVINATGVFADDIVQMDATGSPKQILPSRGSHLVIDRDLYAGESAMMIPKTPDGRILFLVPWLGKVIIGTTDIVQREAELEPRVSAEEVDYILETAAPYLSRAITRADVQSAFAGLRPLAMPNKSAKSKSVSRSHRISRSESGMVTVVGGKWTTFRQMGQDVVDFVGEQAGWAVGPSQSREIDILDRGIEADWATAGRIDGLPYSWADMERAVAELDCYTVEDVLCRRTRCLFLDAAASLRIAESVAELLAAYHGHGSTWVLEEVERFRRLAAQYRV